MPPQPSRIAKPSILRIVLSSRSASAVEGLSPIHAMMGPSCQRRLSTYR